MTGLRTILLGLVSFGFTSVLTAQEFKAGAAEIDITPPLGYAMWGYGDRHDKPSDGVLDPLHARALVLSVGDDRIAIVGLDLGRAPTRQSTAAIRARLRKEAGIEHFFLVGSHTHHGPVIEIDTWPDTKTSYVRELERKLGDVILEANNNLQPARLGIVSKQVPYNRNRHSHRPDKPVDPELLVVRVETADGKPIAHAVNFAAHPTMIESRIMKFSADYPGAMAALVEKETNAPCLFLQGAAGDMSVNSGPAHGPVEFGRLLGKEVLDLSRSIQCAPVAKPTLTVREDDFQFRSRTDFTNPAVRMLFVRAFYPDLVDFYLREYREGVRPHLTTALLDGRIGLVGVSGEFFSSHSLSLKRRARLDHVLFLGYCNDYQQYFPTIEAASEGGYGADSRVSPVEVGSGERMIDKALLNLYAMRGLLTIQPAK